MPNLEPRLNDFLDWAQISGIDRGKLPDFRRIALELWGLSDGRRITESHILHLLDDYADRPGGREAVALIEEVGETVLRFQAARPDISSTPVPPTRPAPPVSRMTPSQPFTARPEERVAGELRPPAVVRSTPPEQPVVSFTPVLDPPPRPRARSDSGRSAVQFRCPRCKVMVAADDQGTCPRCGTPAPKMSSAPRQVVAPPSRGTWLLALVVAGVAVMLGTTFGPGLINRLRHPSEPVAGTYVSPHLGVRLVFPEDWRHSTEDDRAPSAALEGFAAVVPEAISLRGSRFFRGQRRAPAAELILVVAARPATTTDAAFEEWAQEAAANPASMLVAVREVAGVAELRLDRCEAGAQVPRAGLRCSGSAGKRRVLVYVFGARSTVAIGLFRTSLAADVALDEANDLIAGLDVS